eukprot:TRINITY_DN564_c0_g1_i1.p1 TRINITY_DN564_c0_g1~~TRINITY_DN564_c0_g1_i1.p1  ORF type:complete len:300 (+),score=29.14 TRINITY_DN564_c0_g1_i1:71-970(+)
MDDFLVQLKERKKNAHMQRRERINKFLVDVVAGDQLVAEYILLTLQSHSHTSLAVHNLRQTLSVGRTISLLSSLFAEEESLFSVFCVDNISESSIDRLDDALRQVDPSKKCLIFLGDDFVPFFETSKDIANDTDDPEFKEKKFEETQKNSALDVDAMSRLLFEKYAHLQSSVIAFSMYNPFPGCSITIPLVPSSPIVPCESNAPEWLSTDLEDYVEACQKLSTEAGSDWVNRVQASLYIDDNVEAERVFSDMEAERKARVGRCPSVFVNRNGVVFSQAAEPPHDDDVQSFLQSLQSSPN